MPNLVNLSDLTMSADDVDNDIDDELEIETRTMTTSSSSTTTTKDRDTESAPRTVSTISTSTRRLRESGLAYMSGASLWDMAILLAWMFVIILLIVVIVESIFSAIEPESRLLGLWIIFIVLLVLACMFTTIITYARSCSCHCRPFGCCIRSSSPEPSRVDQDETGHDVYNSGNEQHQQETRPRCGYGCCSCLRKTKTKYSTIRKEDVDIDHVHDMDTDMGNDLDLQKHQQQQQIRERYPDQEPDQDTQNPRDIAREQRRVNGQGWQGQKRVQIHQEEEEQEQEQMSGDEPDYRIYGVEPSSILDAGSTRGANTMSKRGKNTATKTHQVKNLSLVKKSPTQDKSQVEHFISMKQTGKVAPATQSLSRANSNDNDNGNGSSDVPNFTPKIVPAITVLSMTTTKNKNKSTNSNPHIAPSSPSSPTDTLSPNLDKRFQEMATSSLNKSTLKIVIAPPADKPTAVSLPTILKPPSTGGRKINTSMVKSKAVV